MKKRSNTISACAYMLGISEDTLVDLLNNEDVIRKLENKVKFYESQVIKQEEQFKKQKQEIINLLNK